MFLTSFIFNTSVVFVAACVISSFVNAQQVGHSNKSLTHPLTLSKAINVAQKNDPWLTGNIYQQRAIESMSTAVNTLPDPTISIGLVNLPTNGFSFDQEAMTQAKIGIAQRFPRGDTLDIKSQQLRLESEAYPFQRQDREAKIAVTVGGLWLDAYRIQESIALIEKNRALFEQLADIAEASYASAMGKTRQQDIVSAQLELTRLDDRLAQLSQQKNSVEGMLSQWLTVIPSSENTSNQGTSSYTAASSNGNEAIAAEAIALPLHNIMFSREMPQIELSGGQGEAWLQPTVLVDYFASHPAIMAIDKKVTATKTGVQLAEQKYKPEWGVNASYGYREDDPFGNNRADLFSVGVTFDLPLFSENKQDQEVQSAIAQTEAVKTEKLLLLRQLLGAYSSAKGGLKRLKERQSLYRLKLLPQTQDQVEAVLAAYTNDNSDFSDVVRSRIALLNAEIDELTLNVAQQKIHLELNYLFIGNLQASKHQVGASTRSVNTMNYAHSGQYKYTAMSGAQ